MVAVALLGTTTLAAAATTQRPTKPQLIRAAKKHRLHAFPTCDPFLTYVRSKTLDSVGPFGRDGDPSLGLGSVLPATAPAAEPVAGVDYSPTNVQEDDVDEPDIVKSNGRTMFTVADGTIRAIRLDGASTRSVGSLTIDGVEADSLLLAGKRLLVLGRRQAPPDAVPPGGPGTPVPLGAPALLAARPDVVLTEVDVTNPAAMAVEASLTLADTTVVDARLTGETVRIVLSSRLGAGLAFTNPATAGGEAQATAANRAVIERATAKEWLPTAALTRAGATVTRPLLDCAAIRLPARFSGLGLLSILTLDLRRGLDARDADAIVSDGEVVYASASGMYVTTTRWFAPAEQTGSPAIGPHTVIHKFDTRDPVRTRYRASGSVPGFLHRQWSMSELRGQLRVASTELPPWNASDATSQSFVTVLDEEAGALIPVGRVGGIGRGEQVYAVRFVGDQGYVVTFRRVDPLHVLDLSDPTRPRVVGELEIPGYSSYLHPIGPGLLLGVGQDADAIGRVNGAQVSVFDVSDPRNPRRVQHHSLGRAWSEAEWEHHAFLYWPPTALLVLPLQGPLNGVRAPDGGWFAGAVALRAAPTGVDELGRLQHPTSSGQDASVRRAMVARGSLYTVSPRGILVSTLDTLARRAWVPFS